VLVLPPLEGIRAETAECIAKYAKAGLPIFFADRAPDRDEGLADAAHRDARVKRAIASALRAGAKVVPAAQVPQALRNAGITANLIFTGPYASNLYYVQRLLDGRTITFLYNRGDQARDASLVLPAMGGVERWNAMDGTKAPVSASAEGTGTRITLALAPGESALLVQDPKSPLASVTTPQPVARLAIPSDGWSLKVDGHVLRKAFASDMGTVTLKDWRDVRGLENFSGTATYRRAITVDPAWLQQGKHVTLDLGAVHDIATVSVNGTTLPTLIAAPFRVDLTGTLKPGANDLVVTIANTPQNAMLDAKAPGFKMLKPVPAGWAGPVALKAGR
jgi:hypothetical protein